MKIKKMLCIALSAIIAGTSLAAITAMSAAAAGARPDGAGDNTPDRLYGDWCQLYPAGSKREVTIHDDAIDSKNYDCMMYQMGSTTSIKLAYDSSYNAYRLCSFYANQSGDSDKCWDIAGKKPDDGAQVQLWSKKKSSDDLYTKQLWHFYLQTDGSYLIQNVKTGKYLTLNGSEKDGTRLIVKSSDKKKWTVEQFNDDRADGTQDAGHDWMSHLPDSTKLTALSIPGTHDTGTADCDPLGSSISPSLTMFNCQKYYVNQQLNVGIRAFDVRVDTNDTKGNYADDIVDSGKFIPVLHTHNAKDKDRSPLYFNEVLNYIKDFFQHHPGETVIMAIKDEGSHPEYIENILDTYISSGYIYQGYDKAPTLGECRGKIVLMRRFNVSSGNSSKKANYGYDVTDWDNHNYDAQQEALKIVDGSNVQIWIQDNYKSNADDRKPYVSGTINQMNTNDNQGKPKIDKQKSFVFNYTSCATNISNWNPFSAARNMNDYLMSNSVLYNSGAALFQFNKWVGITMMDWIDARTAQIIYSCNFDSREHSVFEMNPIFSHMGTEKPQQPAQPATEQETEAPTQAPSEASTQTVSDNTASSQITGKNAGDVPTGDSFPNAAGILVLIALLTATVCVSVRKTEQ